MRAILAGMHYSGLDRLFDRFSSSLGMVLMFHHVSDAAVPKFAPNAHLTIHPDFLDVVIRLLKGRDIDIISIDQLNSRIEKPVIGRRFAVLTFDDGYRDNLETAYPVLRAHDVPFCIYLATGLIEGGTGMWWRGIEALVRQQDQILVQLPGGSALIDCSSIVKKHAAFERLQIHMTQEVPETEVQNRLEELCWFYKIDVEAQRSDAIMNWGEISGMAEDPNCTFGAHTITHPMIARLSEKQALSEMKHSAQVVEAALGQKSRHFAYPYGMPAAAGPRDFELARKAKFKTAVTTRPGMIYAHHAEHLHALPRISVNGLFQRRRYMKPLMSGLPTSLANRFRKVNVGA